MDSLTDGYEILARILHPKMSKLMTIETQKLMFGSLGINLAQPESVLRSILKTFVSGSEGLAAR